MYRFLFLFLFSTIINFFKLLSCIVIKIEISTSCFHTALFFECVNIIHKHTSLDCLLFSKGGFSPSPLPTIEYYTMNSIFCVAYTIYSTLLFFFFETLHIMLLLFTKNKNIYNSRLKGFF